MYLLCQERVIQEALTNVLVHAKATRAIVEVELMDDELRLRVHDDGMGDAPPTIPINRLTGSPRPDKAQVPALVLGGNGLIGMRERAAACGGFLTIGSSPLGGWQVTAVLRSSLVGLTPGRIP